jgi:hypothetical protein
MTARRVLEPVANDLRALDCFAKLRQLLLGDLAQSFGCRVIRGACLQQYANLLEAQPCDKAQPGRSALRRAARVAGPRTPSGLRCCAVWNATSARSVDAPKTPSIVPVV